MLPTPDTHHARFHWFLGLSWRIKALGAAGFVLILTVAGLMHATLAHAAPQATYFVAPNGSDSNNGLDAAHPFATITHARDVVRTVNSGMTGDIVVYLRGGTYAQTQSIAFTATDSGSNGFNVIYQAYSNEVPVISGGLSVTGWHPVSGSSLWQASVPAGLVTRQLYINGTRATRAKIDVGLQGTVTTTSTGYITTATTPQNWINPHGIEFVYNGYNGRDGHVPQDLFSVSRCPVDTITGTTSQTIITMQSDCYSTSRSIPDLSITTPTNIENSPTFLTQAGQWYLDTSANTISYWPLPGENMTSVSAVVPQVETLLSGTGTPATPINHVQFSGITFAYGGWTRPSTNNIGFVGFQTDYIRQDPNHDTKTLANVAFHSVQNVVVKGCTFIHLGGMGIEFDQGAKNNMVTGNVFTDISASAVQFGDIRAPFASLDLQTLNNTISDNYIHDIGVEYSGGVGIWVTDAANTTIVHNEIGNLPYTGITLGYDGAVIQNTTTLSYSQNNVVAYNHIHHFMRVLADGGGIYTMGPQGQGVSSGRSSIHDNFVHTMYNNYGAFYPDEYSAFEDWYHNVASTLVHPNNPGAPFCQAGPCWLYIWTGSIHDNTFHDNYSDTNRQVSNGLNNALTNNNTSGSPWDATAQGIINAAGLEGAYQNLFLSGGPSSPTNLALNKPTFASSQYAVNYGTAKANDGNLQTGWGSSNIYDPEFSWQLDLVQPTVLTSVQLVTRQDVDDPVVRRNFAIWASNNADMSQHVVLGTQGATPLAYKATFTATVTDTTPYRYLAVVKTVPNEYAFITEFNAAGTSTGTPTPTPTATSAPSTATAVPPTATPTGQPGTCGTTNLAVNKPTTVSSVYSSLYTGDKAVDGNQLTGWSPLINDNRPSLVVDLGQATVLCKVQFATRQDEDQSVTRQNFTLQASNDPAFATYATLYTQSTPPLPFQTIVTANVTDSTAYRYVRAIKTVSEYFFISEISVFGSSSGGGTTCGTTNLALNKPTTASSVYSTLYTGDKAVDGNQLTGWSPLINDNRPSLVVDLGQATVLCKVQFTTRQDEDQSVTRQNFTLQASNDPAFATYTSLYTQGTPPLAFQTIVTVNVTDPMAYRYVRAVKSVSEYFFASELSVFGSSGGGSSCGTANVALNKPTTVSSVYSTLYTGDKAVDGNLQTGWSPLINDNRPSLVVDLGQATVVCKVQFATRQDEDQSVTRQNFTLQASNDPAFATYATLYTQGASPLPFQAIVTANVTDSTAYRYVRAVKTTSEYFFASELSVFAR